MNKSWPHFYDAVFSRLKKVNSSKGFWTACCPAHEDDESKPSLTLKVDGSNGKLMVKCHGPSACAPDAIMKAIGCTMSNMFPDHSERAAQKMQGKFLKAYDYRDEHGKLSYQVVRWEPKNFTQRRPNPSYEPNKGRSEQNREYLNDMQGVRLLPYRLPELLKHLAAKPNGAVFLLEGEKACDRAAELGLVATCSPQGAGKWHCSDYFRWLKGANVICLPDNDPVGEKSGEAAGLAHMEDAAISLIGWAASVRIIHLDGLPLKGDFYDWVESRADKSKESVQRSLKVLLDQTGPWKPSQSVYRNPANDEGLLALMSAAKRLEIGGGGSPSNWYEVLGRASASIARAGAGSEADIPEQLKAMAAAVVLALKGIK